LANILRGSGVRGLFVPRRARCCHCLKSCINISGVDGEAELWYCYGCVQELGVDRGIYSDIAF